MPLLTQRAVVGVPVLNRTVLNGVQALSAMFPSRDPKQVAAIWAELLPLTKAAVEGMELPLSTRNLRSVMKELCPSPGPGSLVVMDGRYYHATPATPVGELRASLYCALEDKRFKTENKLAVQGYV
jgi:hypothetical protein